MLSSTNILVCIISVLVLHNKVWIGFWCTGLSCCWFYKEKNGQGEIGDTHTKSIHKYLVGVATTNTKHIWLHSKPPAPTDYEITVMVYIAWSTYIHIMTLFKIAPMFLSLVVSDDIMLIHTHTHFDDSQSLQQWTLNESIITKTGDQVVVQNPERKIFLTSFLNIQCH